MEDNKLVELDSASVGIHLSYIRKSIEKIEGTLGEMKNIYVGRGEHDEVKKIQIDHEARVRILETTTTKIMTWGSALVVGSGIIQFIISSYLSQ